MKVKNIKVKNRPLTPWRRMMVLFGFASVLFVLTGRALDMQVIDSQFFKMQGDARQLRVVPISAHRGQIVDRNGEPFAVSTPVKSIWVNPGEIVDVMDQLPRLADALGISVKSLRKKITSNRGREFIYLKRHIPPELANKVMDLKIPGVALQEEYRRYYPSGEVAAHVVGFSDIDDRGQEGLELAFDEWLKGEPGKKRIIRDRLGRAFDDVEHIRSVEPGKSVKLSIDKRLQYLAYRTLKAAVIKHNALAGSAVILDVDSGEVLAMVNQPSFNVNDRNQVRADAARNRAVTDVFEPGSTMKPLTMAAALESGRWKPNDKINTEPGYLRIQGNLIQDIRNLGNITVSDVIAKSSNVGISKIALAVDADEQWGMYQKLGLGIETGSGFPGEAAGRLSMGSSNNEFERASLAFGYGVSVTPLQLARAYAVIASGGLIKPVSFIHREQSAHDSMPVDRVMSEKTASSIRAMMERVVSDEGTGNKAQVANYTVAGKTGTVHKFIAGGYAEERYLSIFAGMIPATSPELVMVVMIDEPRNGEHFGGLVAAPVFSNVMAGAVRLLDIPPDKISDDRLVMKPGRNMLAVNAGPEEGRL